MPLSFTQTNQKQFLATLKSFLSLFFRYIYFLFGFTPCKAEQPLQGMELQQKEAQKD